MIIRPAKRTESVQEYYFSRKLKEIALIMGCTDSYLRSRLQWIRKYLCHTINTLERK